MNKITTGTKAPVFTAPVTGGPYSSGELINPVKLTDRPVLLYFYPKDATPGCTTQACGLRDAWGELADRVHVFGISPDSIQAHEKFILKQALPFALISDETHAIAEAYGVWVEKNMYGRKYMGVERTSFLVEKGRITQVWHKVKPAAHAELILNAL